MAARNESYRSRYRSSSARGRERGRGLPEVDAPAVAMTVQILICVLLLLAAGLTKMADEQRFASIKREYAGLVSGEGDGNLSDYFAQLAGITGGFFTAVENLINQLLGRPPAPPDPPAQDPGQDFSYGYLEDTSLRGSGSVPFHFSAGEPNLLPAPAGKTLAPYYLNAALRPPVTGALTSPYAYREHPISGRLDFHNGVDIAAPHGRGVLAALPGEVEEVGEDEIYGKYVILRHASNLQTFYAHCSEIIAREGMKVNQGERIARVGATGMATGPHLHFSLLVDGLYADPALGLGKYIRMVE